MCRRRPAAGHGLLADKAYDANTLRAAMGAEAVNAVEPFRRIAIPTTRTFGDIATGPSATSIASSTSAASPHATERTIHFPGFALLAAPTIWIA